MEELILYSNYHDQKIRQTPSCRCLPNFLVMVISNIILIPPFKNYIIIFPAHEAYVTRTHDSDLGRRSPGGNRVRCREYVPIKRHIRSSVHDLLIRHRLYVAWTGGLMVEFRLLHAVVVGSISSGGDQSVHCWWDLIRSKQLSSVSICPM